MNATREDRPHQDLDLDTLAEVHRWTEPALTATVPVQFGSAAWADLSDDDPAKAFAVIRAAVAWWSAVVFGSGVPEDVLERLVSERINAASKDVANAADWSALIRAHEETQRVLKRRRSERSAA